MLLILVTFSVLKVSVGKIIFFKEVHPSNMLLISFTFWVLKWDKSKDDSEVESLNIPLMFSTCSVFNLLKSILFNLTL